MISSLQKINLTKYRIFLNRKWFTKIILRQEIQKGDFTGEKFILTKQNENFPTKLTQKLCNFLQWPLSAAPPQISLIISFIFRSFLTYYFSLRISFLVNFGLGDLGSRLKKSIFLIINDRYQNRIPHQSKPLDI